MVVSFGKDGVGKDGVRSCNHTFPSTHIYRFVHDSIVHKRNLSWGNVGLQDLTQCLCMDVTNLKHHPALSDNDVAALFAAGKKGNEAEMKRIVESRGLIWHGALVETSHLQQHDEKGTLP